ncbi:MAG: hypothetical protein JWN44_3920 [Myxococcales bacterium]|nr:hypothetical protein [Myxococcales bacterium]
MEHAPKPTLSRIVDLIAVAAVAVVVLLPSGSLVAKPALVGDKIELDRVAALEDARFAAPDDVEKSLALADAYLRAEHPDWALETTSQFAEAGDHRIHLTRATAYAERLQPTDAVAAAERASDACEREGAARCSSAERVRIGLVAAPMQALLDQKIDPRKDPKRARAAVAAVLHATKAGNVMMHAPKPGAQPQPTPHKK